MIQPAVQNDTILKQLDQAVDLKTANEIEIGWETLEPPRIRLMDSINSSDSVRNKVASIQQENSQTQARAKKDAQPRVATPQSMTNLSADLDSVVQIQPKPIDFVTEEISKSEIVLPEKKIERESPDWAIGVFILAFIIFASVKLFFNKYLKQVLNATINYPTASRLFRERSLSITHASFRLDVLFLIIFSYFIFQLEEEFLLTYNLSSFLKFIFIFAAVLVYFFGKRIVYLITGFVSESISETQEYLYNINLYNRVLGLFLLPVSLTVTFASLSSPRILLIAGVIITFLVYFLLLFRGARILLTKHFSIFYLILYLCTLEILPLVFIYKLIVVLEGVKQL